MKIATTHIGLQATHQAYSRESTRERLESWVGDSRGEARRPGIPPGQFVREIVPPRVEISADAQAISKSAAAEEARDEGLSDPRMLFLKQLIEAMTGREIRTLRPADLQRAGSDPLPAPTSAPDPGERAALATQRPAGFGLIYEHQRDYVEYESLRFEAHGEVRTQDGRTVAFRIELEFERLYQEHSHTEIRLGDAQLKDPLVLDFAGPASGLADTRFSFDLDADGESDAVPLLPGGKGFLAFDRNGNGRIDDGSELFGPTTGDGFAELRELDADRNSWVDESDPDFAKLAVWSPSEDGTGELVGASSAGLGAIYLGGIATPFEIRSATNETVGVMRSTSIYLREDGSAGTVSQIDLSV